MHVESWRFRDVLSNEYLDLVDKLSALNLVHQSTPGTRPQQVPKTFAVTSNELFRAESHQLRRDRSSTEICFVKFQRIPQVSSRSAIKLGVS